MPRTEFWTPLGVRMSAARSNAGAGDWLFFPGGPGIGSECLAGLVALADLPGTSWLVDLPGDGSNVDAPGAPPEPYGLWPHVLLEAVDAVERPVVVGHSTGGEYLLSVPTLADRVAGMVLVSSAPDASWLERLEAMTATDPLPAVAEAALRYERDPSAARLRELTGASAPWNFEPDGLAAGRELLAAMPYNPAAVAWSAAHFDRSYVAAWWPTDLPTLIISGAADRIVDQTLWEDPRYAGANVTHAVIDGAGHWPWIDRPGATRAALRQWSGRRRDP